MQLTLDQAKQEAVEILCSGCVHKRAIDIGREKNCPNPDKRNIDFRKDRPCAYRRKIPNWKG